MRTLPILLLTLSLSTPALALSRQGHEIVGELAERQLSPSALAEVRTLLADEPEPRLAAIAAWADQLRDQNPELGKHSAPWHYINFLHDGCRYVAERECPNGDCVVGAIEAQSKRLADRSLNRGERAEALKFVVHFVGDVHQPMHANERPDKGGNTFQIRYRDEGTSLHGIWDYHIVNSAGHEHYSGYADALEKTALPLDRSFSLANPAAEWALESCRSISEQAIYPPAHALDDAYIERQRPFLEQRLRQAGDRLARVLEAALSTRAD